MMFLSAVESFVIWIVVPIIVVQYAFAVFCLLKLAYFDVSKKEYIGWNLLILIVFFIGGIAFLIYYFKHPDKRVKPISPQTENKADGQSDKPDDGADEIAEEAPISDGMSSGDEEPGQE